MLLTQHIKNTGGNWQYAGCIWGSESFAAKSSAMVAAIKSMDVDDEMVEHPANGTSYDDNGEVIRGYYEQGGDIYYDGQLVLKRLG